MSRSQILTNLLEERLSTSRTQEDVHTERIIVLDDAKSIYSETIRKIDGSLLDAVEKVNDSIYAVNDAYQSRIDAGCRTDLFWRLIKEELKFEGGGGKAAAESVTYYTYQCVRLNPSGYLSVGEPPRRFPPYDPRVLGSIDIPEVGVSTTTVEYVANSSGKHESVPLDSLFGLEPVNLYAIKMYDEPYTHDIGDTFVTSFIGTCGVGTNTVVAMTPSISGGISNIETGQLLVCGKANVFNSDAYKIIGIGTATANLSGINTISDSDLTSNVTVPLLTLDDQTLQPVFAPEDDGNYVTFTVLKSPETFGDLSLKKTDSPYVPQTIRIMDRSTVGLGVRIEFDNSGEPSASQTWNQYLEGQPDPDVRIRGNSEQEILRKIEENIVREPKVGGGKVFHRVGLTAAPVIFTNSQGTQYRFANEGETVTLSRQMGEPNSSSNFGFRVNQPSVGVIDLPTCSSTISNFLNESIATFSDNVAGFASTSLQDQISVVNMLRQDVSDINIRIWSERQLLGDAQERQTTYTGRIDTISNYSYIID